jgi:hypothetical protein
MSLVACMAVAEQLYFLIYALGGATVVPSFVNVCS